MAASVRARLLNVARAREQDFGLVLARFAIERLLYRLGCSIHANRFVLKGATLMSVWFEEPFRPTRDLDLLGYGDPTSEAVLDIFRKIMGADKGDGIVFDADGARIGEIRAGGEYGGLRIRTTAYIGTARIPVNIDIGFGDATEPGVETRDYPAMLPDLPRPRLRAYAPETVVAEKFQAMVKYGRANSRIKDYYDIWILSELDGLGSERLARAIAATFDRRRTEIPIQPPSGLAPAFALDPDKQRLWEELKENAAFDPGPLPEVVAALERFLMPAARAARAVPPPPEA